MCKDGSCSGSSACYNATIPYVVGPSCTGEESCYKAKIGSAYKSCTDRFACQNVQIGSADSSCYYVASCEGAQLSGVDLINSCNKRGTCIGVDGNGDIIELIDCCNIRDAPCYMLTGDNIIANGGATCVSYYSSVLIGLYLSLSNDSLFSHSCSILTSLMHQAKSLQECQVNSLPRVASL